MLAHSDSPFPIHVNPTTGEIIVSSDIRQLAATPPLVPPFSTPSYSAAHLPARLVIASGGEFARVTMPKAGATDKREWKRGTILDFTARSRSRMLQSMAKTDRRAVSDDGVFVTLTYPRDWPPTTKACKAHLEAFRKRLERQWPHAWFYWKLEYQKRGAEHFHLLIFNLPTVNPEWFHATWHDIVKLGNHWHKEYGADVKRMDNWKQAGAYCAKYVAKVEEHRPTPEPGRFWGIATRRNRVETIVEARITEDEFYRIRRLFKRHMRQKSGYYQAGGSRSGVWTRITNGGAKRALEYASSARAGPTPLGSELAAFLAAAGDTPAPYNGWSSRAGLDVAQRSSIDRNTRNTRLALFDSVDLQRAWARQN